MKTIQWISPVEVATEPNAFASSELSIPSHISKGLFEDAIQRLSFNGVHRASTWFPRNSAGEGSTLHGGKCSLGFGSRFLYLSTNPFSVRFQHVLSCAVS